MTKIAPIAMLAVLLLGACGSAPTAAATSAITQVPSATPAPSVSPRPTIPPTATITLTPTLTPTPYPVLFRDDFDGSIDKSWHWVREEASLWSVTADPGWLEIKASSGFISHEDVKNILTRPVPKGDFGIETKLKFKPDTNYQTAYLLVYRTPGDNVEFGRSYCDQTWCAGDQFDFTLITNWENDPEHYQTAAPEEDTLYLRLLRQGTTYSAFESVDGAAWSLVGKHTSDMKPSLIGLLAGGDMSGAPEPALFDYFLVFSVP
jgi:beta-xylosidase